MKLRRIVEPFDCEVKANARCVLVSVAGTRIQSARPGTCRCVRCLWNGAAMKLRLIEQACGYSLVRGVDALNVCARLCTCVVTADSRCMLASASVTRVQSACRHDQAPASACPYIAAMRKLRLIEQA